ncbi:MAG: VWA domain-containing protein [Oscillospiraceae bacterium]|nr:VWA domain-containing protein [Oscillospiraceae bacterium]
MKRNNLLNSVSEKLNLHNKQKIYKRAVSMVALFVVFCTVAVLTKPAETLEQSEGALLGIPEAHTHAEECYRTVVCGLEEIPGHTHDDTCLGEDGTVICELAVLESHAHTDECYTLSEPSLVCELTETEGHTHTDGCMAEQQVLLCTTVETEGHAHTDECMVTVAQLVCETAETEGHTHADECMITVAQLVCETAETEGHTHTEECNVEEAVLSCGMAEGDGAHVHTEGTCWTMTKSENLICALAEGEEHTHSDACYETVRTDICTLEETAGHAHTDACWTMQVAVGCGQEECAPHTHTAEAGCYVDAQTTGCGLEECEPHTHAAESGCYADAQAAGCGMEECEPHTHSAENGCYGTELVAVCGAEECDSHAHADECYTQENVLACGLEELTVHTHSEECYVVSEDPVCGLEETVPPAPDPVAEDARRVEEVIALIDALPRIDQAQEAITVLEEEKDYLSRKAILQQVVPPVQEAFEKYNALTGGDKAFVTNADILLNAEWLLTVEIDHFHPALETDDAYVEKIDITAVDITRAVQETDPVEEPQTETEETPQLETDESKIFTGDKITYSFTVDTAAYEDMCYGRGRIKIEFVLPFDETQATFDMDSLSWLDTTEGYAPQLTAETRTVDGEETACQVLTGYILLTTETEECAVPSSYSAAVTVLNGGIPHGQQLALTISAAMDHNIWSGECEYHLREEKLSVTSAPLTAYNPLSAEEQQANFEAFLAEIEALDPTAEDFAEKAEELRLRILKAFRKGEINEEQYDELVEAIKNVVEKDKIIPGEYAEDDSAFRRLMESGWVNEYAYAASAKTAVSYTSFRNSSRAMFSTGDITFTPYVGADDEPSDEQIPYDADTGLYGWGGTNKTTDGVSVSKTIDGTALENVFDITLTVTANESINEIIEEPDMAVAIVMDISNTMRNNLSDGVSRYQAAVDAAEDFLDEFAAENTLGISKVGFVAFNTDAHEIFELQECTTSTLATLKNELRTGTSAIINASGYKESYKRYTNIEAGLAMGYDMIKDAPNDNKYVIFLSDGFPTTYMITGTTTYEGYEPYTSSGTPGADGVFYDAMTGYYCNSGTSYSDEGAIRARKMATTIKTAGVNVFSIGVDIGGQTIEGYDGRSGLSVIDRMVTDHNSYELGSYNDSAAFKNWLGNSIGSGYYYDSTDSDGLQDAYDQIFAEIKRINAESTAADWVATDPMSTYESGMNIVEFIGLYDKDGELRTKDTVLQRNGNDTENSASFNAATNAINWDLKKSYCKETETEIDETTTITVYEYSLKYRVRLKNEVPPNVSGVDEDGFRITAVGFQEGAIYDTNNPTSLQYTVKQTVSGVTSISDPITVQFPIPKVYGYLSEISFDKVDIYDKPVVGAQFTLAHNDVLCAHCRGDIYNNTDSATGTVGTVVTRDAVLNLLEAGPLVYTAVSDAEGKVSFANIPSGHQYILTETQAPAGYAPLDRQYLVTVAYDNQTITVTDLDGNTIEEDGKLVVWDGKVVNITSVELPSTGGIGTVMYTAVGSVLTMGAAAVALINKKRKESDE